MLRSANVWALWGMYGFLGYSGNFFLFLFANYLQDYRHFDKDTAKWLTVVPFACGVVACIGGGALSDRIMKRTGDRRLGRRLVGGCGLALAGAMILATPWVDDVRWLGVLYGLTFLGNDLAMGPAWAAAGDIGERHAGTLAGAMNMMASLMAALAAVVAGQFFHAAAVADGAGDAAGHRLFMALPFVLFAASYVLGALCWLRVDVTETIPQGTADRADPGRRRPSNPGGLDVQAGPVRPLGPGGPGDRCRAGTRPRDRPGAGPPRGRRGPRRPRRRRRGAGRRRGPRPGRRAAALACDVADEDAVRRTVAAALAEFGRIDVLVNNAGITKRIALFDWKPQDWEEVIRVNQVGTFLMAREVGRHMVARRRGSIVNVVGAGRAGSSGLGRGNAIYCGTKGAVAAMTRDLAAEWARFGVRVNAVAPGWFRTEMNAPLLTNPAVLGRILDRVPLGRLGEPEDVVGPVVFLASDASAMITGHVLPIDGGVSGIVTLGSQPLS